MELIPQPIGLFVARYDPDQLVFGLEKHLLAIQIEEHVVNGKIRFALPYMDPCAMTYRRGMLYNRKLTLSTVSAYWNYPSADKSVMVKKDNEFVRWAKKVMASSQEQLQSKSNVMVIRTGPLVESNKPSASDSRQCFTECSGTVHMTIITLAFVANSSLLRHKVGQNLGRARGQFT